MNIPQVPTVKGLQKFLLYILLLAYIALPFFQIALLFNKNDASSKKKEIDKSLLQPRNYNNGNNNRYINENNIDYNNGYNNGYNMNYEITNGDNFYQENNVKNTTKNDKQEFEELFETYEFLQIILLIIAIIIISWDCIMSIFICISFMDGTKCAATCCMICGNECMQNCVANTSKAAMFHPFIVQSILEGIYFILLIVHLNYSKKIRPILPSIYLVIYDNMVEYEKDIKLSIGLSIIIICCTIGYKILDKCYFNKTGGETIHVVPVAQSQ